SIATTRSSGRAGTRRRLAPRPTRGLSAPAPSSHSGPTPPALGRRHQHLQVYTLLTGGGYAEKVVVPAGQLLPTTEGGLLTDSRQLARGGLHRLVHRLHASPLSPGESFLVRKSLLLIFSPCDDCKRLAIHCTCFFFGLGLAVNLLH
uniref:Uncharacterized protein n=1 Tax=Aegilops tauschii subsp. strangulata TaxID=200361 RepID=A0A453IDE2_AEGTS